MHQRLHRLTVQAARQGLRDISDGVREWLSDSDISMGLLTIFCRHTSCSLLIQENAAPAARGDLERYFSSIAPESGEYEHDDEGPDDMRRICARP